MNINVEAVREKILQAQTYGELERVAMVTDVVADMATEGSSELILQAEHLLAEVKNARTLLADCALQACQDPIAPKHS